MKAHGGRFRSSIAPLAIVCVLCVWMGLAPGVDAGMVGSPHDFSPTGPWTQSANLAPAGICSACHVPHGAQAPYLWVRNLTGYSNPSGTGKLDIRNGVPTSEPNFLAEVTVQCYDCHDYHNTSQFESPNTPALSLFNSNHRPQNILFGFTKNGVGSMTEYDAGPPQPGKTTPGFYETNPPGPSGNFGVNTSAPLSQTGGHYFQQDPTGVSGDGLDAGGKLPCSDCHDPHAWNSNWQAFIRPSWPTSSQVPSRLASVVQASRYMANDSTPTNRRSDVNSRYICIACHGTADTLQSIYFDEIQPSYQHALIARPPVIAAEHFSASQVACVSCHVHNSVGASCTSCHGFPPSETASPAYPSTPASSFVPSPIPGASDSHPRHYGRSSGSRASVYSFNCDVCHYGSSGTGAGTLLQHQNGLVSVVLQGAFTRSPNGPGGTYDNTNYFNQGGPKTRTGQLDNTNNTSTGWGSGTRYGGNSCQNVYCHSAGRATASMADNDYRVPLWNAGGLGCDGCHGPGTAGDAVRYGMPNYANGGAGTTTANSHAAHVVNGPYECSVCHAGTLTGTGLSRAIAGTTPSLHVNRAREVQFGGGVTGSYDNVTQRCSVSCHGSDTPRWGGTLVNGCFSCHAGAEAPNKPQDNAGLPNPVDYTEYIQSGHGRSTNYPVTNNPGAGKWDNTGTPVRGCYSTDTPNGCHDSAAPHTTGIDRVNDPFRLADPDTVALCLTCHGPSGPAVNRDMQLHAKSITAPLSTKNWPGAYDWKCVDCHDPHGDGTDAARRIAMIRSAINNPIGTDNGNVGSDSVGRPRRAPAWTGIVFTDNNGLFGNGTTTGSYAIPGTTNWGICEGCHRQTSAYKQTADNTSTHATRTGNCTTCHPHNAGFAAKACKGCHGPDGVATVQGAPDVSAYWTSSGHGMTVPKTINVECEGCHDVGFITGLDHRTDGSAGAGPPPANINTYTWPGKSTGNANTDRNANTVHLRSDYFPAGYPGSNPSNKYNFALSFDQKCGGPATGCHPAAAHNHHPVIPAAPLPVDRVMRFGDGGTVQNPKAYNWYPSITTYNTQFYQSRSPWDINDITTGSAGTYPDNAVRYGLCVSCHDPHGTNAPANLLGANTNRMLRGDTRPPNTGVFCNTACHTTRTPP